MNVTKAAPRGIRNENPGNIRHGPSEWRGLRAAQTDPSFCQFDAPIWGLRAIMMLLLKYQKSGFTTISEIINRWAPPVENKTNSYVASVSAHSGFPPHQRLDMNNLEPLVKITKAIVLHENGEPPPAQPAYWYGPLVYVAAAVLALNLCHNEIEAHQMAMSRYNGAST